MQKGEADTVFSVSASPFIGLTQFKQAKMIRLSIFLGRIKYLLFFIIEVETYLLLAYNSNTTLHAFCFYEKGRENMRIVLTIVGKDKVGIIAKVSNLLAEHGVNILNINQNILEGFFNMVLIADMTSANISLKELKELATALGNEIGVDIRVQHEDIFTAMHRI